MHGYHLGVEEVNGIIIGGEYFAGRLFYNNKPQGQIIYADTEEELIKEAKTKVEEFKHEVTQFGLPLELSCYSDSSKWELRIYN